MKLKVDENVLVVSNKAKDLNEVLDELASKDSKKVAAYLVEHASLPREMRIGALRLVLNDYVKMAKDLVLSDENPEIELIQHKKYLLAVEDLKADKVDAIVLDSLPAEEIVNKNPELKILENTYNQTDIPILINDISNSNIHVNFTKQFSKINLNILRQISEIEYSPVSVDEERFLLYMSDGNFLYVTLTKIDKVNKYNEIRDVLGDKKGVIYLDSGNYVELKS